MNDRTNRNSSPLKRALIPVVAGSALGSLAGMTGLATYLVRRITVRPRGHRPPNFIFTPWEFGIPFESVRIPVEGGEIDAWYLPQADTYSPVVLGFSGLGGTKSDLLGISRVLHKAGFAMLLIDYRGTGLSTGSMRTLGHSELADARAALEWITCRNPASVLGAIGFSLGGSVAIKLAGTDERLRAVVADSPFASQYGVLSYNVRRRTGVPSWPVMKLAEPMFWARHRHRYADFAPVDVIGNIHPRPLLMIHHTDDRLIPMSEAEELWRAAGESAERWIVEGVAHCGAYFDCRDAYCERVVGFFRQSLVAR